MLSWPLPDFEKLQEMPQILKENHPTLVSEIYHRIHYTRIRSMPHFINTCLQ
ncbi:hypothetical protein IMY05_001G0116200 [Salix suchowensis]|nr:hypothetical protein IMY05_001G0116200 [Salix suchowensis]